MLTHEEETWLYTRYYTTRCFIDQPGGGHEVFPCFLTKIPIRTSIKTKEEFHELIRIAAKRSQKGALIFSVTEKEENHKMVLKASQEYEGVSIGESISRWHGNYKVWLIFIPIK